MQSSRPDEPLAVRDEVMPAAAVSDSSGLQGVVGDASDAAGQLRSGEDVRRRGWFWHWNSIVTQFSPIIGLKGVGLLNSYTVWTDRREESPHRGFAFPSQQSEADFYGEDRNELITINKILVALDLIEIKKHMVPRTDERGRNWKVPHNLYRVKDHGDEFTLTTTDVRRVVELADRDAAVYRYVRRIFSSRFSPIDRDNVWHTILEDVQDDATWQKLAAKTARDEERASQRSKAGHVARKTPRGSGKNSRGDRAASETTVVLAGDDSASVETFDSEPMKSPSAASTNNGLDVDVAQSNNGLGASSESVDAQANTGAVTNAAPTSTTYYQQLTTTTEPVINDVNASGGYAAAPDDQRDRDVALRLYREANDREASAIARRQLLKSAEFADDLGEPYGASGWGIVGAAIEEAVASGSTYVAPKRVHEIVMRWEREGLPAGYASVAQGSAAKAPTGDTPVTTLPDASHRFGRTVLSMAAGEIGWDQVCDLLEGSLPTGDVSRLRRSVNALVQDDGSVRLATTDARDAKHLDGEWRDVMQRKIGVALRRPVRIDVVCERGEASEMATGDAERETLEEAIGDVMGTGMSGDQVWHLVLDDLFAGGGVPATEITSWMQATRIASQDRHTGVVVIGVPSPFAERRAARYDAAIAEAVSGVIGRDVRIRIVQASQWVARTGTDG